jgi:hypothetical protein
VTALCGNRVGVTTGGNLGVGWALITELTCCVQVMALGGNQVGVITRGNLGLGWALITELTCCVGDGPGW